MIDIHPKFSPYIQTRDVIITHTKETEGNFLEMDMWNIRSTDDLHGVSAPGFRQVRALARDAERRLPEQDSIKRIGEENDKATV